MPGRGTARCARLLPLPCHPEPRCMLLQKAAGSAVIQWVQMASPNLRIDAAMLGRINRAFGVIGLLAGIAFLIGGGWFIHHTHLDEFLAQIAKSATAEGTVIENRAIRVHPPATSRTLPCTSYKAFVTFVDGNGRSVTLPDQFAFGRPSFFVGQRVKIFYDPQNPQHAMIDRGRRNLIIPAICLVVGGLMVLGSIQRLARPAPIDSNRTTATKTFRIG